MTIQDLLTDPRTNNLKLIGDQSLISKNISSVNVIDNPDVTKWFKKDELVLTSGYFFYNDINFAIQIIHDLSANGCCALGIKIKRFLENIPDEIITEAAKCGLALLEIPYFYAMSDVMECIFSTLQREAMDNSVSEYNLFSSLMSLLNDASGLPAMLDQISRFTAHPVMITTNSYQPVSSAGFAEGSEPDSINPAPWEHSTKPSPSSVIGKYETLYINHVPEQICTLLFPNRQNILCILSGGKELSETLIEAVSHTLPILELELSGHPDIYQSNALSKPRFSDILTIEKDYTPSELIRMCDYFGFPYAKGRVCTVLRLSECENSLQKKNCIKLLIKQLHTLIRVQNNCYLCESSEYIILFFLFSPDTSPTLAVSRTRLQMAEWYAEIQPFLPCRLHIGISSFTTDLSAIRQSYYDALKLVDLYRIPGLPDILVYQEQLLYFILLEKTDKELSELVYHTLGALASYEQDNPSLNLMTTYKTYITTHFNSTEAAKKLYIHRNTFLKRIDKIDSLIGIVSDEDRSFSSLIGIYAYEILMDRQKNSSPIT